MDLREGITADAVERWLRKGLIDAATAERLREELEEHRRRRRRRILQLALAGTAAVVLVFAAVVFLRDVWASLGAPVQSALIFALGVALFGGGLLRERRRGFPAVAYGLQLAGLGAVATAYGYSETAWPSGLLPGQAIGALAVLTPPAALAAVARRNRVMPAAVVAGSYLFFSIGLHRVAPGGSDVIVWILDGIWVAVTLAIANAIRIRILAAESEGEGAGSGSAAPGRAEGAAAPGRRGDEGGSGRTEAADGPEALERALVALAANLYVAFPLLAATAEGPLDLDENVFLLFDGWLLLLTGLLLWGIHRAPEVLRRGWYGGLLTVSILLAVPTAYPTVIEVLDGTVAGAAAAVAGVGLAGLLYGLATDVSRTVEASCLALVVASWSYALSEGTVITGALALGATAALLFWLASRLGGEEGEGGDGIGPAGGSGPGAGVEGGGSRAP